MKNWRVAVGSLSSWSGWVIATNLGLRLLVALVSDPNRTNNYSPLWLITWLLGVIAMTVLVLIVMALGLKKRLQTKPRPLANLTLIGLTGALGNTVVALSAFALNLDNEGIWHIRIFGGALAAILEFTLVNALRASLIARRESIRRLTQVENQLLGYRDSAKQIIQDEIETLKTNTKATLLPQIERIQNLIAQKSNQKSELVDELKLLINQEVRPLSKAVLQEANTLAQLQPFEGSNQINLRPSKYRVALAFRPGIATALFAATFPMVEFMLIDHRSAFRGLLGGLAAGITIAIAKALIPNDLEVKIPTGIAITSSISALAIAPAAWIMWQEYGFTQEVLKAIYFLLFIAILGAFLLSYTKAVELNQERYEKALAQYTEELSKEVALFEQKLSLERRSWSRIIHGEVQSALTAAATRLQREEHLENYHLELVKQDLNRAKENLTNPTKPKTNFNQTLAEITKTWQQICQINTDISARASRALDQSEDTREATIEIIKEAISNAIRHGDAKEINIKLNRHQDDILEIEIENNGRKLNPDAKKGLGSQMIDELTLTWHMENKTKPTLKTQIPISKNQ